MDFQNGEHFVVNANHGHEHHCADHTTRLYNFSMGEICEFSAFPFSLQLMFDQTLSNLIVCLMISHKLHKMFSQTS